jgi:hypothetical protein
LKYYSVPNDLQPNLFLGIELETGCNKFSVRACPPLPELPEIWYNEDSSINAECECEIISHPCTLEYHKTAIDWQDICGKFKKLGFKSWNLNTCGIHIHTNKDYLTANESQALSVFFYHNIDKVVKIARRSSTHFSQIPPGKAEEALRGDWTSRERYEAINWGNRNTIEFRVFRGTLIWQKIYAYLEFIDALMQFSKRRHIITSSKVAKSSDFLWSRFVAFLRKQPDRYSHILAHGIHVDAIKSRAKVPVTDPELQKEAISEEREVANDILLRNVAVPEPEPRSVPWVRVRSGEQPIEPVAQEFVQVVAQPEQPLRRPGTGAPPCSDVSCPPNPDPIAHPGLDFMPCAQCPHHERNR